MPDAIDDAPPHRLVADIVDARRQDILRVFRDGLAGGNGSAVGCDRLLEQANAVLDDITRHVGDGRVAGPDGAAGPSADLPAQSPAAETMRASRLLFRAVIQAVAADLPGTPVSTDALTELACVAHESAVYRLTFAADGYANYLLDRLHRSHVDERRRVARELHDIIAHAVAVVLQDLELFAVRRGQDAARAEAKLTAATQHLRDTLELLRTITQDLRQSAADSGLTAALRSYLEMSGLDRTTDLQVTGDEAGVSPAVRGELFLVLREALRNAHRHAAADAVRVEIEIDGVAVRAVVADDGQGFDSAAPPERTGTGLASMRERVALLGGAIELRSTPGNGTSVALRVPLIRG